MSSVGDERGAVMVIVVAALPLLILLAVVAVDVAKWYVHDRHLQTQADAAALAAVNDIRYPASECSNSDVEKTARVYAGIQAADGTGTVFYNAQVAGRQAEVRLALNATQFPDGKTPPPDGVDTRPPCESSAVDVKLSESDLPWVFGPIEGILGINAHAHARAELRTRESAVKTTPIGVVDPTPNEIRVWLVDERRSGCTAIVSSSCVIGGAGGTPATAPLVPGDDSGSTSLWSTPTASLKPIFKDVGSSIGMVVAISQRRDDELSEDLSTACAQALVTCVEPGSDTTARRGLVHIQTYAPGGHTERAQNEAPILREVRLEPGGACPSAPDAYFAKACAVGERGVHVLAKIDFGSNAPADPTGINATMRASISAGTPQPRTMTYQGSGMWKTVLPLDVDEAQPRSVSLAWTIDEFDGKKCKNNEARCKGEFANVQRTYTSNPGSGTVQLAQIGEPSDASFATAGANAFPRCKPTDADAVCTRELSVSIGVEPGLENETDPDADPVELRTNDAGSAKTGTIACDPRAGVPTNPEGDLARGCQSRYGIFRGRTFPWSKGCASISKPDYTEGSQPWQCAEVSGAATPIEIARGMNSRILCGGNASCTAPTCTARNNWRDPDKGIAGDNISSSDPRVVQLFIVPFGSFGDPSVKFVPVRDFGYFYITGWGGQGAAQNPCQIPDPTDIPLENGTPTHADDPADPGEIVGHYFKFKDPVNDGGAGSQSCDPNAFGGCVAVLTR